MHRQQSSSEPNAATRALKGGSTSTALLLIAVVILVVALIAVPRFGGPHPSGNESAAISQLRAIASAQERFRSLRAVDSDADGCGEYGFLGELSGLAGLRAPDAGAPTVEPLTLTPALLSLRSGKFGPDGKGEGVMIRSGYCYKLFLPGASAAGVTPAIAESGGTCGGATAGSEPDPTNGAILWCAYAWPTEAPRTGRRAFFVNQRGQILQFANETGRYSAPAAAPAFDAAFSAASPGDMSAPPALTGMTANDGNSWTPVP